jgi:acetyltransferase-like isoleucine patch superfamily enzyme
MNERKVAMQPLRMRKFASLLNVQIAHELKMSRIFEYILAFRYRLNGFLVSIYLRALGCNVGANLKCLRIPVFRDIPKSNIAIGNHVVFGKGVTIEIARTGRLELGDQVVIGDYVKLSSNKRIRMGSWSGIAEHSSIRGTSHGIAKDERYMRQPDIGADVTIGQDVLIGAQVVVLSGVDLPDGVVIGAQSLVVHGDKVHPYGIFAGSPLKHIRDRR